jgi:hypothetical protein
MASLLLRWPLARVTRGVVCNRYPAMSLPPGQKEPLVEPSPEPAAQPDATARTPALAHSAAEILAELGVLAL